jgi:hypothetical protein
MRCWKISVDCTSSSSESYAGDRGLRPARGDARRAMTCGWVWGGAAGRPGPAGRVDERWSARRGQAAKRPSGAERASRRAQLKPCDRWLVLPACADSARRPGKAARAGARESVCAKNVPSSTCAILTEKATRTSQARRLPRRARSKGDHAAEVRTRPLVTCRMPSTACLPPVAAGPTHARGGAAPGAAVVQPCLRTDAPSRVRLLARAPPVHALPRRARRRAAARRRPPAHPAVAGHRRALCCTAAAG